MIGLGSNRLTVCRRGGMSVTQFGMAGMSRTNDFFGSPYSAQATAALVAQFPTQWPTIRDYGFAHPALVPFINEDPMLVMSLIEGLGTRWLVGDGNSWIDYGRKVDVTHSYKCKAQVTETPLTSSSRNGYFGAWTVWNGSDGFAMRLVNSDFSYFCGGVGSNDKVSGIGNSIIELRAYANGVFYINNTRYTSSYAIPQIGNALPLAIMAVRTPNSSPHAIFKGKYQFFEDLDANSEVVANLVPFKSATREGMVDVINATFHPNQGTGHFTTEEVFTSPS